MDITLYRISEVTCNGNKTSLYLETKTWFFAEKDLYNTSFKPYVWEGRKASSSGSRKNPREEKTMLIYVWNLSLNVSEDFFRHTFEAFGKVSFATVSSTILKDREDGQLRRFAFVEMPNQTEAKAAIKNLNRKALFGRPMILYGSFEN